ncbi:MAG: hypothetical protein ABIS69_06670, partial [Sediminibacterium sp.]
KMRMFFLTVLMACFSSLLSYAQPIVKTGVDRSEILIGDQFKLTIEASFSPDAYKLNWPIIPDSLAHFEVISRTKMDSLYSNNTISGFRQTITLTSFDSGKWVLPSFLVNMVPVNGDAAYNFFTDSVPITVSFSTSDTTNVLKDIKPIREVETINPLWYWIGAGVLVIALIIFLIWFYRYWKRNKGSLKLQSKSSAYDEAMIELDKLRSHNLSDAEALKMIHTKMGEILKRYLSRIQSTNYQNKTTGDILILLRDQTQDNDILFKTAASLRCNDAVKFAKYLPPSSESEMCLQSVSDVINSFHQKVPVPQPQTLNPKP